MRILIIGDLHFPFAIKSWRKIVRGAVRKEKPDSVVLIGDVGDGHRWSRHHPLPDAPGPNEELTLLRKDVADLADILDPLPVSVCKGNHDDRLAMACIRAGVPSALHATVQEVYECPDSWEWKTWHLIDDVMFIHGETARGNDPALYAARLFGKSCVCGHYHARGSVTPWKTDLGLKFGMQVGCLVDHEAPGMHYARATILKPVLAYGIITDGNPRLQHVR